MPLLISSFDATIRVKRAFHPAPATRGFCESRISSYISEVNRARGKPEQLSNLAGRIAEHAHKIERNNNKTN